MKTYIKPNIEVTMVEVQPLMQNSVKSTSLNGVTVSDTDFGGGSADSRGGSIWSDED